MAGQMLAGVTWTGGNGLRKGGETIMRAINVLAAALVVWGCGYNPAVPRDATVVDVAVLDSSDAGGDRMADHAQASALDGASDRGGDVLPVADTVVVPLACPEPPCPDKWRGFSCYRCTQGLAEPIAIRNRIMGGVETTEPWTRLYVLSCDQCLSYDGGVR